MDRRLLLVALHALRPGPLVIAALVRRAATLLVAGPVLQLGLDVGHGPHDVLLRVVRVHGCEGGRRQPG